MFKAGTSFSNYRLLECSNLTADVCGTDRQVDNIIMFFLSQVANQLFMSSITVFANPLQRIMDNQVARVPILQGSTQNDGSMFAEGKTDVAASVNGLFHGAITPAVLAPLYPGLSGFQEISMIFRDFIFLWCAVLFFLHFLLEHMQTVWVSKSGIITY
jgi:hypothetical protein